MLRFSLLMIAAGYEDGNDTASLRHDPLFKLASGRLPDAAALCSQPTLSVVKSFETTLGQATVLRTIQCFGNTVKSQWGARSLHLPADTPDHRT